MENDANSFSAENKRLNASLKDVVESNRKMRDQLKQLQEDNEKKSAQLRESQNASKIVIPLLLLV